MLIATSLCSSQCSGGKMPSYCSKMCQKKDYKRGHKEQCKASVRRLEQARAEMDAGLHLTKEQTEEKLGRVIDVAFSR